MYPRNAGESEPEQQNENHRLLCWVVRRDWTLTRNGSPNFSHGRHGYLEPLVACVLSDEGYKIEVAIPFGVMMGLPKPPSPAGRPNCGERSQNTGKIGQPRGMVMGLCCEKGRTAGC